MYIKLLAFVVFVVVATISSVSGTPFTNRGGHFGRSRGPVQIPHTPPFNPHARTFPRL